MIAALASLIDYLLPQDALLLTDSGSASPHDDRQERLKSWECSLLSRNQCPECFKPLSVESEKVQGLWYGVHTCAACGAIYHTGEYLCPSRVQKKERR